MKNNLSVIKAADIQQFINDHYSDIYPIIKQTYQLHLNKQAVNPKSYFLKFPEKKQNRIIALPAAIIDEHPIAGIKWISSWPNNTQQQNIPRASAVIVLNDYENGFPYACLEGSVISATRTACSAVLAAELLNNPTKPYQKIGFIGNGLIAHTILDCFIRQDWQFEQINLFDSQSKQSIVFQKHIQKRIKTPITVFHSAESVIKASDIIVFATTASQPYLNDISIVEHAPTLLHISLRDIGPSIIFQSINIVDDLEHVMSASTSIELTQQFYNTTTFVHGTIASCINKELILSHDRTKIFSPMGMGILDLAIARFIFDKIDESRKHTIYDFHQVK